MVTLSIRWLVRLRHRRQGAVEDPSSVSERDLLRASDFESALEGRVGSLKFSPSLILARSLAHSRSLVRLGPQAWTSWRCWTGTARRGTSSPPSPQTPSPPPSSSTSASSRPHPPGPRPPRRPSWPGLSGSESALPVQVDDSTTLFLCVHPRRRFSRPGAGGCHRTRPQPLRHGFPARLWAPGRRTGGATPVGASRC